MKSGVKNSLIGVAILVVLVLVWWLGSPLFVDKTVNEGMPVNMNSSFENVDEKFIGTFEDADSSHKVSGDAKIISQDNVEYLRFEDFDSTNGPDLKVYLSNDLEASEYVSLGKLKGNKGNQNYALEGVNYGDYEYVLIWCEAFSVLFGYAEINDSGINN